MQIARSSGEAILRVVVVTSLGGKVAGAAAAAAAKRGRVRNRVGSKYREFRRASLCSHMEDEAFFPSSAAGHKRYMSLCSALESVGSARRLRLCGMMWLAIGQR